MKRTTCSSCRATWAPDLDDRCALCGSDAAPVVQTLSTQDVIEHASAAPSANRGRLILGVITLVIVVFAAGIWFGQKSATNVTIAPEPTSAPSAPQPVAPQAPPAPSAQARPEGSDREQVARKAPLEAEPTKKSESKPKNRRKVSANMTWVDDRRGDSKLGKEGDVVQVRVRRGLQKKLIWTMRFAAAPARSATWALEMTDANGDVVGKFEALRRPTGAIVTDLYFPASGQYKETPGAQVGQEENGRQVTIAFPASDVPKSARRWRAVVLPSGTTSPDYAPQQRRRLP